MDEILPSVAFEPDNPRPLGFVDAVTPAHLRAVKLAVGAVADAVAEATGGDEPVLRVRFSSVRYMPTLPFVLYSFHIVRVDDAGEFSDEVADGDEITYALVANHDVEVQRESAVLFLYDLVFRQEAVRRAMDGTATEPVDALVAVAGRQARREFRDRIHDGWRAASRSIAQRAVDARIPLAVRYDVDVLPTREDVVRRMPHLRAAYNEIEIAREAVDKQVSMIGGHDPRVSAPGLSQADEDKAQRQLSSLGLRQWISQVTRDAQVCGNGYMVTVSDGEPTVHALRPETVEIVGPGQFALVRDGVREPVAGNVAHLRGIEQFESAYGISLLEPVLAEFRTRSLMSEATQEATRILRARPAESREGQWARETLALAERSAADSDERLGRLLWYPRDWLPDAREGLYFPGQERM
jgi:hypothetical protein